ncbi:MAG: TetR/AcrR family transcriptional regulator [bacterium]|nr:TetR/AcrR family transcriptional regulator [bacterium]
MNAATRDPERTRATILDGAEEVFLEKGFGNASMSEIARRAKVTKSLIHHHFGSKEELWREVKFRRFTEYAERQMAMLKSAGPADDVGLLRDSMKFYFYFLRDNPQLVRILAWMFLERDTEECIHKDRELITLGVERIREGQKAGKIRDDVDARFVLFIFIGLAQHWFQDCNHFQHDFDTDDLPVDLNEAYLQDAMKIFFEGVLPR